MTAAVLRSTTVHEIPGYSGLQPIGSGATATVYKARQEAIGREVAIKVLAAPTLDAKSQKRFTRESQALGALGWHPNIVVLFDAGQTPDGVPYIAMEYLGGGTLADVERVGPAEATTVGVKIAGALHCAHEAGVLHRDVKPANILRSVFGEAKLADFGISGLVDATHTTGGGMTLAHVAPEVVDGRAATIKSDVYSLASSLFDLTTGQPPFAADRQEEMVALLLRILDDPVPNCRPLGVPAPLADALEAGLAKSPDDRPDAREFGQLLIAVERAMGWPLTVLPVPGAETPGTDGSSAGPKPSTPPGGRGEDQVTVDFPTRE